MTVPVRRVAWPRTVRIIRSIHPPIDLFEDIAAPADWEALASAEAKFNPRIRDSIGDLSKVWVDLHVFGADAQYLRPGVAVTVSRLYDNVSATTTIERVLPSTSTASQSLVARAALPNEDGFWRPGTAVKAQITMSTSDAGVVIPQSAIQSMDGKDVVFVRDGDTYTARPVKLGDRDSTQVAVLEGVKAGEDIVVTQSYLVKADIEKSGATHAH